MAKKITLATLKSFVRKNLPVMFICKRASFDGMTDCVEYDSNATFQPAKEGASYPENTLGIAGVWLVGSSRDHISRYEAPGWEGFEVYNCCGTFVVAVKVAIPMEPKL